MNWRQSWPLAALLLAFFALALAYTVSTPVWEGPDEPEHFQYVRYLVQVHRIPSVLPTIQPDGNNEGKQAPLYYVLALPFVAGVDLSGTDRIRINPHAGWQGVTDASYSATHVLDEGWPWHGIFLADHLVRVLSALLGVGTLALVYAMALEATGRRGAALAAALLVAGLPGFLFASSTINNDALADTLAAALLLVAVRGVKRREPALALWWGGLGCAALFTKLDLLLPLAVSGIALVLVLPRKPGVFAALILPLVPAAGFWLWRVNAGTQQLLGRATGWPPPFLHATLAANVAASAGFLHSLWGSLFGLFGWTGQSLPLWLLIGYSIGLMVGLLAAIRAPVLPPAAGAVLWAMPLLNLAAMVGAAMVVSDAGPSYSAGRLLYLSLGALSTLVAIGWARVLEGLPRWRWLAVVALVAYGFAALLIPLLLLRPHWPQPWPVTNQVPVTAHPVTPADFAQRVTLAAANIPPTMRAGSAAPFTLYWQVTQPLPSGEWLFIHVENAQGASAAAFDGSPQPPVLPLDYWRPGDVIIAVHALTIHTDALPGHYAILVGWYDRQSGTRLALANGGNQALAGGLDVVAH